METEDEMFQIWKANPKQCHNRKDTSQYSQANFSQKMFAEKVGHVLFSIGSSIWQDKAYMRVVISWTKGYQTEIVKYHEEAEDQWVKV